MFGIPIRELQQQISSKDFIRYVAFLELSPSQSYRADVNSALLRQVLYAVNANKKSDIPDIDDLTIDYMSDPTEIKNEKIFNQLFG